MKKKKILILGSEGQIGNHLVDYLKNKKRFQIIKFDLILGKKFDEIYELNNELLHVANEFKQLFPEGSQGGKASSLIWDNRATFDLYNDNFINSIANIGISIENEDTLALLENFNIMTANCGTCHKKFRN